jgi:hypothetical protein
MPFMDINGEKFWTFLNVVIYVQQILGIWLVALDSDASIDCSLKAF